MAANSAPIFSKNGHNQWVGAITAANNTKDLTSGTSYLVCTADATNGSWLRGFKIKVDPANSSAASVMRFWLNNGSTVGTAANSIFIGEISIPAVTASATAAQIELFYAPVQTGMALNPGYSVYVTIGTAPGGSAQFSVCAVLGDY